MPLVWETQNPEATRALARALGSRLHAGDVIAYLGGLGAGKTTFTQGLAQGMGLEDTVTSPTFSLVHEYGVPPRQLIHFDMYRIEGEEALETTGFYEYPLETCVFAVEWSEHIRECLPAKTIWISLEILGDTKRRITLTAGEEARFADIGH